MMLSILLIGGMAACANPPQNNNPFEQSYPHMPQMRAATAAGGGSDNLQVLSNGELMYRY